MLKRWKKLSSHVAFQNPWWTYQRDSFQIPDGITGEYHYVHTNGASMVIPITAEGSLLMVNQYRYLCDKESLEFPCGGVKQGKSYDETAALELLEETGCQSTNLLQLGEFNPYNGVTDEICKVYVARDLIESRPQPDATEEFEIIRVTEHEMDEFIRTNKIWDGMTLAAWALLRHRIFPPR